jgi:hypothetical protein
VDVGGRLRVGLLICWLKVNSFRVHHNILNQINNFNVGAIAVANDV